jgi:trehalose 6-phosphate phosphatase
VTPDLDAAITAACTRPDQLLVALDFDGTLAPLHDDPSAARMLPQTAQALTRLLAAGVRLALVSGRGLADLARVAEPPVGTVLVGSHGAERALLLASGLDRSVAPLAPEQADTLATAAARLAGAARGHDGVWVEAKPTAAVLHVRLARPDVGRKALDAGRELGSQLGLHVLEGKNVVELCVLPADKGAALRTLRADLGARTVVFAGDDTTDEAAFATLGGDDVGIKVGDGATAARYRLADPHAMADLLVAMADAVETGTDGSSSRM